MGDWVAPDTAPERWMVYGAMGSWKSSGALEIARKVKGKLWVVDTDDAYRALLAREYSDVADKVEVRFVDDWPALVDAMDWAFGKADAADWVVVDSLSDALDFGLDHYNLLLRGQDTAAYLAAWAERNKATDAKKAGTQGALIEGSVWDFFGPAWRAKIVRRIKAPGCNVYMTAQAQPTGNPKEDAQTKELFGGIGWKPRTQRDAGFNAATVVYVAKDKMGKGSYSVAKNWGRERTTGPLHGVPYENLAMDLLFKKCKWRPERKT